MLEWRGWAGTAQVAWTWEGPGLGAVGSGAKGMGEGGECVVANRGGVEGGGDVGGERCGGMVEEGRWGTRARERARGREARGRGR